MQCNSVLAGVCAHAAINVDGTRYSVRADSVHPFDDGRASFRTSLVAPWLIVVFGQRYGIDAHGERIKHYYTPESVGIAMGMLITAVHHAGLASLTHTPAPMKFLNQILKRPANEAPYLILVLGYPAENATVPDISRKPFAEVATFVE